MSSLFWFTDFVHGRIGFSQYPLDDDDRLIQLIKLDFEPKLDRKSRALSIDLFDLTTTIHVLVHIISLRLCISYAKE